MKPRIDPSPSLLSLAAFQGGVLTTEQVEAHGLGRHSVARLRADGRWTTIARGIYLIGAGDPPWEALAWASVLLGGDAARLGGRAAGHLAGLNDPPAVIDVLIPETSPRKQRGPWRFVRERPAVRSPKTVGSPPRLTVEETVLDLSQESDPGQIADIVTTAVRTRGTTPQRLRRAMQRRSFLRHRQVLADLVADVADGVQSPLELNYARDVERAHGLPRAVRQLAARRGRDFRDVTYEDFGIVVELDGRVGHEGRGVFRDATRDNAAVVLGEVTLRYGWFAVLEWPCQIAFQVGHVLRSRGWSGLVARCPRCRAATEAEIANWIL